MRHYRRHFTTRTPQTNRDELEQTFAANAGPTKIRLTNLATFLRASDSPTIHRQPYDYPPKDVIMVLAPASHFDTITEYLRNNYPKINSQNPPPTHTYPTCRRMQFLAKSDVSDLHPTTINEIIQIHHQHIASETSWTEHNLRPLDTPITFKEGQPTLTIKQILTQLTVPHREGRLPKFHHLTPPIIDASQNYKFPVSYILYPEDRRQEVIAIMSNIPRAMEVQFNDRNLATQILKPEIYDEYIDQDRSSMLNPH